MIENKTMQIKKIADQPSWILWGEKSRIQKGVHIGNNSIIAAGSIVTHDIPENCIAAGIPAKVVKYIDL